MFINSIKLWLKNFFEPCPRKLQFTNDDPPLIIAGHRGSPTQRPENTIPSFDLAIKEGANALEFDLCLTKDNKVILWHDWDPNEKVALIREAGFEPFVKYKPHPPNIFSSFRKPIDELTLNEVRDNFDYKKRKGKFHVIANAHIPTLEEFFQWASDKKQLQYVFLDNKTPIAKKECAVKILDCAKVLKKKYNPHFEIIVETTYPECFEEMKKAHPDFSYSLDIEPPPGLVLEPEEYSPLDAAIKNNNSFAIGLRPRKITIANWTTFRRIMQNDVCKLKGLKKSNNTEVKLVAATVSKRKELRCLVRLGVDGIQTDLPARLKRIARRYGRKIDAGEIVKKLAV